MYSEATDKQSPETESGYKEGLDLLDRRNLEQRENVLSREVKTKIPGEKTARVKDEEKELTNGVGKGDRQTSEEKVLDRKNVCRRWVKGKERDAIHKQCEYRRAKTGDRDGK